MRYLKKRIVSIICLLCVLVGAFVFYNHPMNNINYIKKNSRDLKLNDIDDNSDLDLIWKNINDKSIIFTNKSMQLKRTHIFNINL